MESIGHSESRWTDRLAPDGTDNGPRGSGQSSGLHHDCSTWDELYEDDDGELLNAWSGPTPSTAPMPSKKAKTMASSSPATVLSDVANALIPGAEIVLRMNSKATT